MGRPAAEGIEINKVMGKFVVANGAVAEPGFSRRFQALRAGQVALDNGISDVGVR